MTGVIAYEHEKKILAVRNASIVSNLLDKAYFMRFGEKIGQIENGRFSPDALAHRALCLAPMSRGDGGVSISRYEIPDEKTLDVYLRGGNIEGVGDTIPLPPQEYFLAIAHSAPFIKGEPKPPNYPPYPPLSGGLSKSRPLTISHSIVPRFG